MKIQFAVQTGSRYHSTRLQTVLSGWWPVARRRGHELTVYTDSLYAIAGATVRKIDIADSYNSAIDKTMAAVNDPCDADWLIIADDDSYFFVSRLEAFLAKLNPRARIAAGYKKTFSVDPASPAIPILHGGPGMILSRPTLRAIQGKPWARHEINSDVTLSMLLNQEGVRVIHADGMLHTQPADPSTCISCHMVRDQKTAARLGGFQ
ncbi:MAG: hypothetical protein WCQ16_02870 [Verrucomicrobiae bacterium]